MGCGCNARNRSVNAARQRVQPRVRQVQPAPSNARTLPRFPNQNAQAQTTPIVQNRRQNYARTIVSGASANATRSQILRQRAGIL